MDRKARFERFLDSFEGYGQDSLIESIKEGFHACFENGYGYAPSAPIDFDVSEIIDNFKRTIGNIGSKFTVSLNENLPIPAGLYKVLKFLTNKRDPDVIVEKEDSKGMFGKKKFKLNIDNFLRKKH